MHLGAEWILSISQHNHVHMRRPKATEAMMYEAIQSEGQTEPAPHSSGLKGLSTISS